MIGPDFDHFARLVRERSGLVLGPDKAYLLKSRLEAIARSHGLPGVPELLALIRKSPAEALVQACTDALATHESSFFRDGAPFQTLSSQLLPELTAARRGSRTLRIWCAACSSGQEPYSVAMTLEEAGLAPPHWRVEIVATDFSRPILEKAKAGLYSEFEVRRGLTPERIARWFAPEGGAFRISPQLRQMVTFREHNLLSGTAGLGAFDIVFCRNVLIYFDVERKRKVLEDLARVLAPDGALFLGSAETILGLSSSLQTRAGARGVYQKAGQAPGAQAISA